MCQTTTTENMREVLLHSLGFVRLRLCARIFLNFPSEFSIINRSEPPHHQATLPNGKPHQHTTREKYLQCFLPCTLINYRWFSSEKILRSNQNKLLLQLLTIWRARQFWHASVNRWLTDRSEKVGPKIKGKVAACDHPVVAFVIIVSCVGPRFLIVL